MRSYYTELTCEARPFAGQADAVTRPQVRRAQMPLREDSVRIRYRAVTSRRRCNCPFPSADAPPLNVVQGCTPILFPEIWQDPLGGHTYTRSVRDEAEFVIRVSLSLFLVGDSVSRREK